jgi:hypothetical protein
MFLFLLIYRIVGMSLLSVLLVTAKQLTLGGATIPFLTFYAVK